ncbi:Glycine zipper-containing protein [Cryptosporidium felis]|nr:Glycine zipper-containing protein [Cryptosporidium felis]
MNKFVARDQDIPDKNKLSKVNGKLIENESILPSVNTVISNKLNCNEACNSSRDEAKMKINTIQRTFEKNDEKLIEELMVDLSSLLVRLRNDLEELEDKTEIDSYRKKTILDFVRVCISVGLRVGKIIENKCIDLDERCFILNNYSLSYNWFTYWNDNFPKSNSFDDEIGEFDETQINYENFQNDSFFYQHSCTINCVKYEKSISDYKMLSKIANNLFHKAFIMSIWNSKNNSFIEIDSYNTNEIIERNFHPERIFNSESNLDENIVIQVNFNSKERKIETKGVNDYYNDADIFSEKTQIEQEESNHSYMNSLENVLLPEIVCSSLCDISLDNSTTKNNGYLRNHSRRASIIMENIDFESLVERKNKVSSIKNSVIKMREVQTEIHRLIVESTGEIDFLEDQTILAQINTAKGTCSIAQGSKSKSNWWPFQGSTAGLVCGGAAGLALGPIGVSLGAAVGGALGLTLGNALKTQCQTRMDKIIQECETRSIAERTRLKKNSRTKGSFFEVVNVDGLNSFQEKEKKCRAFKEANKSSGCPYISIESALNEKSTVNSKIEEKYDSYIFEVTLSDILENVDIIP